MRPFTEVYKRQCFFIKTFGPPNSLVTVRFKLTYGNALYYFNTGLTVQRKDWDIEKGHVIKHAPKEASTNKKLADIRKRAFALLGKGSTPEELKAKLHVPYDESYAFSVRAAKAAQILDPGAAEQITGMDVMPTESIGELATDSHYVLFFSGMLASGSVYKTLAEAEAAALAIALSTGSEVSVSHVKPICKIAATRHLIAA